MYTGTRNRMIAKNKQNPPTMPKKPGKFLQPFENCTFLQLPPSTYLPQQSKLSNVPYHFVKWYIFNVFFGLP